jgi:hypothetical protein
MKDFTAELEQVFGVVPSAETGLLVDTFDGADVDGDVTVNWSTTTGRPAVGATGWTRASICRVAWTTSCRASVPA